MGIPVVEAPCEAEAQCAELAKGGKVFAAVSEDMDTLTFGTPRLVRKLFASESQQAKTPPMEVDLEKAIEGLGLTMDQFVDVCILSGCDYCSTIKGVAGITALKLVKQHGSLAGVLANIDREKHSVPDVDWDAVRAAFIKPEVTPAADIALTWGDPDEAGLIQFLVTEKGFQQARIESGIAKLKKARAGGQQLRMDAFFTSVPKVAAVGGAGAGSGGKRKAESTNKAVGKLVKKK